MAIQEAREYATDVHLSIWKRDSDVYLVKEWEATVLSPHHGSQPILHKDWQVVFDQARDEILGALNSAGLKPGLATGRGTPPPVLGTNLTFGPSPVPNQKGTYRVVSFDILDPNQPGHTQTIPV